MTELYKFIFHKLCMIASFFINKKNFSPSNYQYFI